MKTLHPFHYVVPFATGAGLLALGLILASTCGPEGPVGSEAPGGASTASGPAAGLPVQNPPVREPDRSAVPCGNASRFDSMDFSRAIIRGDAGGGITVEFPIGIDQVGFLTSDGQGRISYEEHPVPLQGDHQPVRLGPAERESLAVNIQRHLLSAEHPRPVPLSQAQGSGAPVALPAAAAHPGPSPLWQALLAASVPPRAEVAGAQLQDLEQAAIQPGAQGEILVRVGFGTDMVGTLRADPQGNIMYGQHPVSFAGPDRLLPLRPADVEVLAAGIEQRLAAQDLNVLLWRQAQAAVAAARAQTTRFDGIDFHRATIRSAGGGIEAVWPVGVDQVGSLYVAGPGLLQYEEHPVAIKDAPPAPTLSQLDRESLAANALRFLAATGAQDNGLWDQVVADSLQCMTPNPSNPGATF